MNNLICNIHDDIYKKADRAIESLPRYFEYRDLNEDELFEMCERMDSYIDDLKYALEEIMQLTEDAKERG